MISASTHLFLGFMFPFYEYITSQIQEMGGLFWVFISHPCLHVGPDDFSFQTPALLGPRVFSPIPPGYNDFNHKFHHPKSISPIPPDYNDFNHKFHHPKSHVGFEKSQWQVLVDTWSTWFYWNLEAAARVVGSRSARKVEILTLHSWVHLHTGVTALQTGIWKFAGGREPGTV